LTRAGETVTVPAMPILAATALALSLTAAEPPPATTAFKCQGGHDLTAQFASRGARLVAIVDAGDGPHDLTYVPFTGGGPVKLTWTDGVRTLTWSPGVQIMFVDASGHRMCGRGHNHGRPAPPDERRS
jgi:hypothetical protein